jgi:signal peptidase I
MIAPDDATSAPEPSRRRPLVAVLLSLIVPGAGHLYAGRVVKGLVLWLAGSALTWLALVLGVASTFTGMALLLVAAFGYWIGLAVSAALDARRSGSIRLGRGRWVAVAGLLAVQVALGALPIRSWLPVRSFRIPSGSMEPAVQVGDHLIADMRAWHRRDPQRGDLVIFRHPENPAILVLDRVIGLPGERIDLQDKRVYIDGRPIEDRWATHSDSRTYSGSPFYPPLVVARDQFGPLVIPEGAVFVMGDNRDNSRDSRFLGPIDRSLLIGRPLYIYWSRDRDRIGRSLVSP